jgi:D-alanine-D-alanine ligase
MSIVVDPDWWKSLFDEIYLVTDSRSVNDEAVTRQEIDIFTSLLPLQVGHRILDMCGGHGRHALELCRRGFRGCTVLDYSLPLLEIGARNAADRHRAVRFIQSDARHSGMAPQSFDHVLILGNSLGYVIEPDADLHILRESRRLIKRGGWLLLDVTDGETVRANLSPLAWHEIGADIVVCRQREVKAGRICAREMVMSKTSGMIRDRTYCIRLYSAEDLAALVTRAGFDEVCVHTDTAVINPHKDVGCMNHRLVVTARKP